MLPSTSKLPVALKLPPTMAVSQVALNILSPIQVEVVNLGIKLTVPQPPIPPAQPPAPENN